MTDLRSEAPVAAPVVVARVPVVDTTRMIVGFELVTRAMQDPDVQVAGDAATEPVVTVSSLLGSLDLDLSAVVGDKLLFCTVDRAVLVSEPRLSLPPRRTVLQLPSTGVDAELLAAVRAHQQAGFTLMLEHGERTEEFEELLALVHLVKVDFATVAPEDVLGVVAGYRDLPVRLMASGCDTEAALAWAQASGFELFLGRAVQVPEASSDDATAPLPLSQLQLGMELLSQDLDFDRIEDVLRGDPALIVQLLNMTSAGAGGGLRRQVRSLREALVVMGTARLRQWAALVILSRHGQRETDALITTLVRARMCELLARSRGVDGPFAFTAGLLSALHILLGVPVAEIEEQIKVGEELTDAAFGRHGAVGQLISRVEAHEQSLGTAGPRGDDHDEVTLIAAMAFGWATSYADAMDTAAQS
ncbi:HDOD domain-containing protein [Nocardioides sp. 616]|uniref:EAL and HDOD domain-containing protein n=1 Tax=Nocardioides sp. 616 TaxID=2268090 RepID=UPI000CE31153|nr:HDOD domain-containing protein [Nocardioides sp. 616]